MALFILENIILLKMRRIMRIQLYSLHISKKFTKTKTSKGKLSTYSCQSSRAVPSKYLRYAASAFSTLFVPPPTAFPSFVTKTDPLRSLDCVCPKLELLSILSPDSNAFLRKTVSAEASLISLQFSPDLRWLLVMNPFKSSYEGRTPNSVNN